MPFVKAASLASLPAGSLTEAEFDGEPYVICNAGGDLHAFEGRCPHAGGPLGHGALHGNSIVCPWHAWEFDCRTGACDFNPRIQLKAVAVKVEHGDIFIDVPPGD